MAERRTVSSPPMPTMGRGGGPGGGPGRFAPGEKPKNARGVLTRIAGIYMRSGKSLFVAMVLTAASSGVSVALPYTLGRAFNAFNISRNTVDTSLIVWLLTILGSLYLTNWLITTISGVIMLRVSQRLVFTLRQGFFAKMQKLPLSFYDTRSHGDTMSRLTNDVDNISSTLATSTTQLVAGTLSLVGSLIVMIMLSPPLMLAVLVSVPLIASLTRLIAGRSRAYFLAQARSLGALNGVIEENILGLKMVKAFGRDGIVMSEFDEINENLYRNSQRAQVWSGFMMPLTNVIGNLSFALVAITGGFMSVTWGLPIGTVISFLNYSKQFTMPLNAIAGMFNTIQAALAGAERVFEILDQKEEPEDAPNAVQLTNPRGDVSFEHVNFSYMPEKPVLEDITFSVKAGEVIALVGETGSGKTTIVNLLTRFYDANSGIISIDEINIVDIARGSLRSCFSVVLQETCLFTGSIMDNIRYSQPNASRDAVLAAAQLARAHDFIEKLPDGYDTQVSGSTDNLSQGQRQLLAIARAVLLRSPILILDEATSSVDTKTEKDIQRALTSLMRGRTCFLIAHRLSTIRDANRIMVLADGRILEAGNHRELMELKGRYYEMVVSQEK